MIVARVAKGIRAHWQIRATEWVMVWPAIGIGTALNFQFDMFDVSTSYTALERWATQETWASMVLICAMVRLVALVVNGTFRGFQYSPHMRAFASVMGIGFWSQFCLGFLSSAVFNGGAWSGAVAYSTFVLMELLNLYRSMSDVGRGSGP